MIEIVKLLVAAAPAVREAVVAVLRAFSSKGDEASVRRAIEAAQRLEFELRQELKRKSKG